MTAAAEVAADDASLIDVVTSAVAVAALAAVADIRTPVVRLAVAVAVEVNAAAKFVSGADLNAILIPVRLDNAVALT